MENPIDELHTLGDFIRWGASQFNHAQLFFGHGTENAIDEAVVLVSHALHLPPEIPDVMWPTRLTASEKQTVFEFFKQRVQQRIPAPYLTQEAWFANMRFYVDQRVLIPRSPIAELIEQQFEPWIDAHRIGRGVERYGRLALRDCRKQRSADGQGLEPSEVRAAGCDHGILLRRGPRTS